MSLLFLKTSPVKQYSYENDFSGVFDALHQSFLVIDCCCVKRVLKVSKLHNFVTIHDTDMYDTSF